MDIQLTCWYDRDFPSLAAALSGVAFRAGVGGRGRKARVRLINGFGSGDTLYVGTRGKEAKFLRIYDKWRESGLKDDWRHAWRFEAELTDGYARVALRALEVGTLTAPECLAALEPFFTERGIRLPADEMWGIAPSSRLPREESSTYKRLMWLHNQVRPAIDKMLADGVPLSELRQVLGLDKGPEGRTRVDDLSEGAQGR